jgi:hypothetical protein
MLTLTTQVTDQFGNQSEPATQTFAVHETLPTVTISAQDGDGDNVINHAEAQAGVTLSGSVTGLAAGATFAISVADGSFTQLYGDGECARDRMDGDNPTCGRDGAQGRDADGDGAGH